MPAFASQLAAERPHEIAVRDPDKTLTWAEVGDVLNRVANNVLSRDLGSSRRVGVFAENAAETALAHLGSLLGSASTVPVNFHLTAEEAAYILVDSDARIVFVGPETVDRGVAAVDIARAEGREVELVGWGVNAAGVTPWREWLDAGDPAIRRST